MIKAKNFEILFRENYEKLSKQSRIVWWKGNDLGYNDNIYTSDDLLHDLFFSIKKSVKNKKWIEFNDLDHFFAFTYIRMKSLYMNYLKKKWKRSKLEKTYFTDLGYTYEKSAILNYVFDYNLKENIFVRKIEYSELVNLINKINNEEQKRILLLKLKEVSNDKICNYFNYKNSELRSKIYYARKKLFRILIKEEIIGSNMKFKDFVGISSKGGILRRKVSNKKYLYNNYPFKKDYKDKIKFIIKRNGNKIDLDLLPEILKYNEGHQLKKDLRVPINYALEKVLNENNCFILDGIIYLK